VTEEPASVIKLLDAVPLWGLLFLTIALSLLAIEGGYRFGGWRSRHADPEREAPVATAVAATLGLLAFLLAFTFGLAATRFEARRTVLLDEVNAIGTANLRAGLLPNPHRTTAQRVLREYVDARLAAVDVDHFDEQVERSETLHGQLWAEVAAVAEADPRSIPIGLFIQAVNELIDLHTLRVTAAVRSRIPVTIWICLYAVAAVTLGAMGYHSGLTKARRSLASLAFMSSFAITMWLIADLDRPQQGLLNLSQQPMIDLRDSMAEPGA
jgi:hypothetical protein